MAAGDCTKSSTMLYVWVALAEATFRRNRPLGILGMTSTLGLGICKVPLGVSRGLVDPLGWDLVVDLACGLSYWRDQVWRLTCSIITSSEFIMRI